MWISIILFSVDIIWNNWLTQWRSPGSAPGDNHHLWLDTRLSAGRFTSEVGWCLRFWQRKCHIVDSRQHSWQEVEGLRRAPLTLYLWKASLPGCQHQPRFPRQDHVGGEIHSVLLCENTFEGHHTCFKLWVFADEVRLRHHPLMTLWAVHINV